MFGMTLRVERIGDRLGILLTQAQMDELCLSEDSEVEVAARPGRLERTPASDGRSIRYASADEAFAAYKETEPRFAEVYRELAK